MEDVFGRYGIFRVEFVVGYGGLERERGRKEWGKSGEEERLQPFKTRGCKERS